MTISIASSSSPLLKQLETNGLTASKAVLVEKDLSAARTATTSSTGSTITPATRAAFDAKIDADVNSGKLSSTDAAAVRKTMDNMGGGSGAPTDAGRAAPTAATSSQGGSSGKAGGGGGGGGGGSASKTELSETVTLSGSTMTTVIVYTDGTTSTTTTTATDTDKAKYAKHQQTDQAQGMVAGYSNPVDKGALFDSVA